MSMDSQYSMTGQILNIILVVGALIVAPLLGGFLSGVDRVLTARFQGRKGPPVWQPFYDFLKLLGKERIATSKMQLIWMYAYLMLMVTSLLFLLLRQDMLLIVFILGFAGVCLALGGFSTKSPFSHFGANRELLQMLAYEPILLLLAIAMFVNNGTFMVWRIFEKDVPPLLISMWPIFIAFLIIITIKLRKSPFDFATSHHAHQELVKGLTTEYSGPFYALFQLAEWYELVLLLGIVTLFWAHPIWIGIVIALVVFLLEIVIDNISARMTVGWMLKLTWALGLFLCISNIAYLYFKRGVF